MSNLQQLKDEARREFCEYAANGYSGGRDGLRCSECDSKYSGDASIIQLCPMCKSEAFITKAFEEGKAIGREEATQRTKIELDKYVEDMEKGLQGAYGSYSRQILNIVVSSAKEARTRTLESINPSK